MSEITIEQQIAFIEGLIECCGESAKPKFKAILETLRNIK